MTNSSDQDASFESVLADYLQRCEAGEVIDPHDLVQQHPQHADQLRSFLANHQWISPEPIAQPTTLVGTCIDDIEIRREIARGGMGVVYEGFQQSLGRSVAVKFISDGILADEELRMRFRIEAEAAATLSHPNILPIHAIGSWQGIDYFVMPLVTGDSLQKSVLDRQQSLASNRPGETQTRDHVRQSVALVRDIAKGVAYAHRRGIIHRDLKPENVLMDAGRGNVQTQLENPKQEDWPTQESGAAETMISESPLPKIVDFGLAKWNRDQPQLTRDGQVLGTPHYMSPEQARGMGDVTATTDVYSLGGILFALLTGGPPHPGNSTAEVLASVLADEPPSLRLSWPGGMPRIAELRDLEHVLARAMAVERTSRYRSADQLADDLDRILEGEPTLAGPDGIVHRVSRELTRDQHQASFSSWGRALRDIGIIVLVAHLAMFFVHQFWTSGDSQSQDVKATSLQAMVGYFLPRLAMLAGIAWVIHRARDGLWLPRTAAERPVWSTWIGYLAALTMLNILWLAEYLDHEMVMVLACVMSGFAFIVMAGHMWGGLAILGLGFFLAAWAGVWIPSGSPLFLGGMWMLTMSIMASRYRDPPQQN